MIVVTYHGIRYHVGTAAELRALMAYLRGRA